ncbi:uncharacterized protein LOC124897716 [Capsicum annuum]|uniref:uncharacterized protein LOC124897716 n=1 Tax=Capsicum annuum TaxID=4072 RepID=UPI001FB05C17|nr:uncharacterized protein LOC124897716 [Capsicum annuum]
MKELHKKFIKVKFKYIPRSQNELADALAILYSMIQYLDKNFIDPTKVNVQDQPIYYLHVDVEPDGKAWYYDLMRYLKEGYYPEGITSIQKRTLRRLANNFFLNGEILYRRIPNLGLLRCIDAQEEIKLVKEIHGAMCALHMNCFVLAKKIPRVGYFVMTMKTNFIHFVQKFHQCQIHGDLIHVPPNELNMMDSPWPFAAWGMDIIGPI